MLPGRPAGAPTDHLPVTRRTDAGRAQEMDRKGRSRSAGPGGLSALLACPLVARLPARP
jgi:hypothetical protein